VTHFKSSTLVDSLNQTLFILGMIRGFPRSALVLPLRVEKPYLVAVAMENKLNLRLRLWFALVVKSK